MNLVPSKSEMARMVLEARSPGCRYDHLETASELGYELEIAYQLPPSYGPSAEWYLALSDSIEFGKAILYGDEGLEAQLPWGQFRKDAALA